MPPKIPEDKQSKKKSTTAKKASTGTTPIKKAANKAATDTSRGTGNIRKDNQTAAMSYPGPSMALSEELRERIAQRAYEIHQKRGGQHGSDWEDWLQAEREILLHESQGS